MRNKEGEELRLHNPTFFVLKQISLVRSETLSTKNDHTSGMTLHDGGIVY